jgi:monoamine oxidase
VIRCPGFRLAQPLIPPPSILPQSCRAREILFCGHIENAGRAGLRLGFSNGAVVEAGHVILAIPFTTLRKVDMRVALPPLLRACIKQVGLGANEKLMAGYGTRAWRQANGFVGEAWTDLGYAEVWDSTQRQTDRSDGVLTYYLGGDEVKVIENIGDVSPVGRLFTGRLAALLPGLAATATERCARTAWGGNPLVRGAYTSFRPGQLTRFQAFRWVESDDPAERREVHAGRLVFAGEHVSDEYYGFMNGAAQTGRLAAAWVAQVYSAK